jgi:predicted phosphoribosyltransferase
MALPMVGQKVLQKVAGKADELVAQKAAGKAAMKAGQMVAEWVHQMDTSMGHKKVQPMAVQLAGRWVETWDLLMALPMVGQKVLQKVAGKADELVAQKVDLRVDWMAWWKVVSKADV